MRRPCTSPGPSNAGDRMAELRHFHSGDPVVLRDVCGRLWAGRVREIIPGKIPEKDSLVLDPTGGDYLVTFSSGEIAEIHPVPRKGSPRIR